MKRLFVCAVLIALLNPALAERLRKAAIGSYSANKKSILRMITIELTSNGRQDRFGNYGSKSGMRPSNLAK